MIEGKIKSRNYRKIELNGEMVHFFEYIDERGNHISDYQPTPHLLIEVKERKGREPLYVTYINGRESYDTSLRGSEHWLYEYFAAYTFVDFPEFGFGDRPIVSGDEEVDVIDEREDD